MSYRPLTIVIGMAFSLSAVAEKLTLLEEAPVGCVMGVDPGIRQQARW